MIFTPSVGGLSHNIAEHTHPADVTAGADVLLQTLLDAGRPVPDRGPARRAVRAARRTNARIGRRRPRVPDDAARGAEGDRLAQRRGPDGDQVGRRAGATIAGGPAERAGRRRRSPTPRRRPGRGGPSTPSAPAVSNGHARPSGLNGSCRLSAPAATIDAGVAQRRAPRSARAASPPGGRGPGGRGWCAGGRRRRCRPRRRARRSAAARSSGCMPRLTQWLAVHRVREPGRSDDARRGRPSPSTVGSSVSSVCRSTPTPCSAAICRRPRWPPACRSPSRCGQPPTRSAPGVERVARAAPAASAPAGPVDRPAAQRHDLDVDDVGDAARAPRPAPRCCAGRGPAWCRRGCGRRVKPLAAISRAARSARSIVSATSSRWRAATIASIAPEQVAGRVGARARRGTPCRGGRAARRPPAAARGRSRSTTSSAPLGDVDVVADGGDRAVDDRHVGRRRRRAASPLRAPSAAMCATVTTRRVEAAELARRGLDATLKLGAFFFGGVEMDDAGAGPPAPMDRRYTNEQAWKATTRLRRLGDRGRAPRLRLVLDDRAPLPARGLRGHPERHPALDVDRRPHRAAPPRHDVQRRAAVEPAAPRRGLLDAAQPVGRPGDPRRRPRHGAPRGAAPQRQGRVDRLARQPRPGRRRRAATARCSRSRWRSSAARSTEESFSFQGKHFQIPVPGIPDRGSTVQSLTLVPAPAVPVRDLAGGHQPADARLRAGRRPRRRVLEPAPLVHQALLGHVRRALRRRPRRPRAGADHEKRMLVVVGAHRGHPREGRRDGDAGPRRVLEVPRPVRLEPRLHGRRRQAGASPG